MRTISEENAKVIVDVLQERINEMRRVPKRSLEWHNKIRSMRLALIDLERKRVKPKMNIKTIKNLSK